MAAAAPANRPASHVVGTSMAPVAAPGGGDGIGAAPRPARC